MELFVHCLELFVGRLKLFVGGFELLDRGLELLVCLLELALGAGQLGLHVLGLGHVDVRDARADQFVVAEQRREPNVQETIRSGR